MKKSVAIGLSAIFITTSVSGCATTSGQGGGRSELDRAQGRCVAAVAVGTILGAVVGNNVGSGNAGRGALIGAGVGGVACAIIAEAARERDRVLEYQRMAAMNGEGARNEWVAESGRRMVMTVAVEDSDDLVAVAADQQATNADAATAVAPRRCRYSTSSISVEGMGETAIGRQRWCQTDAGEWEMA